MTISVVTLLFVIGGAACQTMAIKVAVGAQVSQMIEATSLFLSNKGIFHLQIIHPPCLSLLQPSIRKETFFDACKVLSLITK